MWFLLKVTFLLLTLAGVRGQGPASDGPTVDDLLDKCVAGQHHKGRPGPEGTLYGQCTPWRERACCRGNVTEQIHNKPLFPYNFDWHHCGNLSDACLQMFLQDMCFYECSPNQGPWIIKVENQGISERVANLPLCASDCHQWWQACKDDMTCSDGWGWPNTFNWTSGVNQCLPGKECRSFTHYFHNATNFCQNIWKNSYKVVDDSEPCLKQWFDGTQGNPNTAVARQRAEEIVNGAAGARPSLYLGVLGGMMAVAYTLV